MPKLSYPASFGSISGVKCTADIQNREAYLFVPLKTIFTV